MPENLSYIDIVELSRRAQLSVPTIHRLKRQGKIPFYQLAGKGGKLLFPPDAIERSSGNPTHDVTSGSGSTPVPPERLSRPVPVWMRTSPTEIKDTPYAT